jgi:ribonuclease Z
MGKSPSYVQVGILVVGLWLAATTDAIAQVAHPADSDFKMTLLGTSTPNPLPDRFGPSTLVEAGNERLLFDCGRGATIRLWQLTDKNTCYSQPPKALLD